MGILQKADRCMDEAAALFGENKLFLAEKKAQETAGLYKSCGAYEQMAKAVNLMGVIYASIGDVSMSIDCYLEAMDVAVEQGSTEIIMLVNNNIGSLYMELGLYEKAKDYTICSCIIWIKNKIYISCSGLILTLHTITVPCCKIYQINYCR